MCEFGPTRGGQGTAVWSSSLLPPLPGSGDLCCQSCIASISPAKSNKFGVFPTLSAYLDSPASFKTADVYLCPTVRILEWIWALLLKTHPGDSKSTHVFDKTLILVIKKNCNYLLGKFSNGLAPRSGAASTSALK